MDGDSLSRGIKIAKNLALGIGGLGFIILIYMLIYGILASPKTINSLGLTNTSTATAIQSTATTVNTQLTSVLTTAGMIVGFLILVVILAIFGIKKIFQ